jgi:hypothetical protein
MLFPFDPASKQDLMPFRLQSMKLLREGFAVTDSQHAEAMNRAKTIAPYLLHDMRSFRNKLSEQFPITDFDVGISRIFFFGSLSSDHGQFCIVLMTERDELQGPYSNRDTFVGSPHRVSE